MMRQLVTADVDRDYRCGRGRGCSCDCSRDRGRHGPGWPLEGRRSHGCHVQRKPTGPHPLTTVWPTATDKQEGRASPPAGVCDPPAVAGSWQPRNGYFATDWLLRLP